MKCRSCEETVPSKFAHSIKMNMCPLCGGEIMDPALQKVFTDLQTIMKEAEPFMPEVEEWFASNYSLRKGGAPRETQQGQQLPSGGIFDDQNFDEETLRRQTELAKSTINFQQRAGIKQPGMRSIVEKIQNGAADPSEFVGIDPDYGPIDMSNETAGAPLTQKDQLAMMQVMNAGGPVSDDPVKEYYEIEKLKKLQRQQPMGAGKFSRGQ
jgi:Zn-finger nucleic acid-binding protein